MRVVNENRRKALNAGTSIAIALSTVLFAGAARADQATDNLQAQIDALQKQISQIKSQSSSSSMPSLVADDGTLTWHGVTLYGTIDVGVSNQTHGSGYNEDFPTSVGQLLQKNGSGTKWNVTPSGMEQNKIGIKGKERLMDDLDLVFKLETAFNPVSGTLINAQKSQLDNQNSFTNNSNSTTNGSSSRSGQPFQGAAFAGLSSSTYGTMTFGRQGTPMFDDVAAYDPQNNAYAFSPLGWTGFTAGAGNTEDARLDNSIKYNVGYGPVRLAALYQMNGTSNPYGGDDAYQIDLGFDYANLSMDAAFTKKHDAVNTATTYGSLNVNQLAAAVSDSTSVGVFVKYDLKPVKLFAGWERISLSNPDTPLWSGANTLGGYQYGTLTQNKFGTAQVTHVVWTGAKWSIEPDLTLAAAYYMYIQDNWSGGDNGVCVASNAGKCAGTEKMISLSLDYQMTKRFDLYGGVMYSRVDDGLYVGQGYLHNNNLSPAAGLRFKF